jgi:hypothetical protein
MNTEITIEEARKKYPQVKFSVIDGIFHFANEYYPTGSFLEAVLSNDLREAFGRADDYNMGSLFHIVTLCWNEIPSPCWGSLENYEKWLKRRK